MKHQSITSTRPGRVTVYARNGIISNLLCCLILAIAAMGTARAQAGGPGDRPHPPIPVLNWEARSDWKSVKAAGAVGDGVTDDTAAIQRVLDTVGDKFTVYAGDQDTIYFPAGSYRLTAPLRVGGKVLRTSGVVLIGHGRDTRLVWDGPEDQPMLSADGLTYSRYEGLVFDGRGKAGVGLLHPNKGFVTETRYRHLAFLNCTDAGVKVDPNRVQAQAEVDFQNCYFERCGVGVAFLRWNDYDYTFDGCEFRRCGIGIDCLNGNFYVRNTHFAGSRIVDIKAHPEHASSIRRVTSLNSAAFLLFVNGAGPMTLQDVHVSRHVTYTGSDIRLAGAPVTIFDSVFTSPPGGSSPIRIDRDGQRLVLSNNKVEGAGQLVVPSREAMIYEVPPGARGGVIRSAEQRFIKATVPHPGKVFDAKRDFGAKGDGRTDDTAAIQAAIDAARAHGKGAIAYLPAASYAVKDTLKITGSDYYVGGQGYGTILRWTGPEGGTALHVIDPRNVTVEHLMVGTDPGEKNAVDILQTGTGAGSSIVYDGVRVFGYYQKQPFRKGLHLVGLGGKDQVVVAMLQGNLRIINSADATILNNISYDGSIVVEGRETGRNGFLGVLFHLGTLVSHVLYVKDNHSIVASDFYNEQSDGMLHLSGSPDLPPGRVVLTGGRSCLSGVQPLPSVGTTIDNYRGEIFLGGKDFSDHRTAEQPTHGIIQTGTAPVDLYLFGNLFFGAKLEIKQQEALRLFQLGNDTFHYADFANYNTADIITPEALQRLTHAFDDLRRLGEMDLKINYPNGR